MKFVFSCLSKASLILFTAEQGILVGIINSFVHIVMYFYYFLAALGPNVQKYLWWKRYITVMQMVRIIGNFFNEKMQIELSFESSFQVQFLIIFVYLATLLAMDCEVHRGMSMYMGVHTLIFIVMFSNFYRKAYLTGKSKLSLGSWSQKSKLQ